MSTDVAPPPAPPRVHPVGEALHHLRLSGAFYCRSELRAPFGLDLPPLDDTLMFHLVTSGQCFVEVAGEASQIIQPGSLALVPHGRGHRLTSAPGTPSVDLFDLPREQVSERYELLRHGGVPDGDGAVTTMLCGAVSFDHPAAAQLVRLLPNLVHIDSWTAQEADWLQSTLRFITSEARDMRLGGETILTRLCDVVVIQAIRAWVLSAPEAQTGWLGALKDEQVGRALAAVHREPGREWTVQDLADACYMSRSAFSARFTELVDESPKSYVTRYRMSLATTWLRDGITVVDAAQRVGYQSEAAFSRAFKRETGTSPGAVRRSGR